MPHMSTAENAPPIKQRSAKELLVEHHFRHVLEERNNGATQAKVHTAVSEAKLARSRNTTQAPEADICNAVAERKLGDPSTAPAHCE